MEPDSHKTLICSKPDWHGISVIRVTMEWIAQKSGLCDTDSAHYLER
jgi:hypothetical protein